MWGPVLASMDTKVEYGPTDFQQQYSDKMGCMGHRALSPKENDTHIGSASDQKCLRNSGRELGEGELK